MRSVGFAAILLSSSAFAEGPAFVHVRATETPVVLERLHDGSGRWDAVCRSPCSATVDSAADYRIAGDGIRRSRVLTFQKPFNVVTPTPAFNAAFAIGIGAIVTGSVFLTGGVVGASFAGVVATLLCNPDPECRNVFFGLTTAGIGVAISAAVAIVVGVVLVTRNAATDVRLSF